MTTAPGPDTIGRTARGSTLSEPVPRIVLCENEFPAETYAYDLIAIGETGSVTVRQFDACDLGRAAVAGAMLADVLGVRFVDEVPE